MNEQVLNNLACIEPADGPPCDCHPAVANPVPPLLTLAERLESRSISRASEIRYRRLFEAARDGILILDPGTRKITDANPFMTELLGYPREELLGKELWEIGLLKDEAASRAAFRELQENHFIRYEDLPLQTKAGQRHEVEFVSNLYDEDGRKVIQCNIRDITQRKQTEVALRNAKDDARQSRRCNRNCWLPSAPPRSARPSANSKPSPTASPTTCAPRSGPCKASPNSSWMTTAPNSMSGASITCNRSCAPPSASTTSFRMS